MEKTKSSSIFPFSSGTSDPDLNIPVTGGQSGIVSPYMNFDPRYMQPVYDADQYILPEGASHKRGRFEMAFAQIGLSVLAGAAYGGFAGFISGYKESKNMRGALWKTQMLNMVAKQGASSAQSLGVIALMYSSSGVALSYLRGEDDRYNTMIAATATGLLYKSAAGWKSCLKGGAVGFGIASVYVLLTNSNFKDEMFRKLK